MEKSYYFKTKEDVVRYGTSPNLIYENDPQCIPISEEEYESAITELEAKAEAQAEADKVQEKSYVEHLEAENAALLYKVLTGEEFADV